MKSRRVLSQFLFSYLLLLLIPLISAGAIYWQSAKMVEEDTIRANRQYLENSVEILDRELANLDYTIKGLIMNRDVNTFLSTPRPAWGSPDIMKVIRASHSLASYRVNADFLAEFFIYSRINGIIITTSRVHTEPERDYDYYFRFGSLSFGEWKEEVLERYRHYAFLPETAVVSSGKTRRVVPFIQSVPAFHQKHFKGNLMGYIDGEELAALLGRLNRGRRGCVFLMDGGGRVLTSLGEEHLPEDPSVLLESSPSAVETRRIGGREWIVSRAASSFTGLKVLSLLPYSFVEEKISYIKRIIALITAVLLALGVGAALFLAYWNSKPLMEIADIAKAQLSMGGGGDDYDCIKTSLTGLIAANRELGEYKRNQLPLMRNLFLDRFLRGYEGSAANLEAILRHHEIDFGPPPYNVVLFHLGGFGSHLNDEILSEKELMRIVVEDRIRKVLPEGGFLVPREEDGFAWISREPDPVRSRSLLAEIPPALRAEQGIDLHIARGRPRGEVREIPRCYREARRVMEYLLVIDRERKLGHFDDLPRRADPFHYNLDVEAKLVLYVKTGQRERVEEVLEEVFQENFSRRALSVEMINRLLDSLLNTYLRLNAFFMDDPLPAKKLKTLSSISSAAEEFREIRRLFLSLAEGSAGLRDDELKNLLKRLVDEVERSYADPALTLFMIARQTGYKESYLYHVFCDHIGRSFASHLEAVRLRKARELLREEALSIDEISRRVGYGSSHSFRRAFKRSCSLSPSQYRRVVLPSAEGRSGV